MMDAWLQQRLDGAYFRFCGCCRIMSKWGRALLAMVFLMGVAGSAEAWGPEGHAFIADMAEAHLTPTARAKIAALLALEGDQHLDQIASWPDEMRASEPDTGPWHFVDIPLYAAAYDQGRDCHADEAFTLSHTDCVVVKLPEYAHRMTDASLSPRQRLEALKWVVHLVGDIHQPLHTEDDHDHGGNSLHVVYFGQNTNLHAVWDLGVIEHQFSWQLGPHYSIHRAAVYAMAMKADQAMSAQQRLKWTSPNSLANISYEAVQWVNATHGLAWDAYRNLPADTQTPGWENRYQAYAWPVIREQLDMASVRLAALLNDAFK